jgi:Flp pilus assembly protein TadD
MARRAAAPDRPHATAPVDLAQMEAALNARRFVQLKTLIERAKLARQTDPRIDLHLAEYWLANGQLEQALGQFEALGSTPAIQARALQGAGLAAYLIGRMERAEQALQQAVALDASLGRAWNALGAVADRKRDWTLAEKAYAEALRLDPGSTMVLSNRGYSRLLQGRYDEAVSDLTVAVRARPNEPQVQNNLRLALALSGRYDEAFAGVSRRDLHRELNNIGYAALVRGDYVSAEAYLNRALEVSDVFYRQAWQNLVYLGDLKPSRQLASVN